MVGQYTSQYLVVLQICVYIILVGQYSMLNDGKFIGHNVQFIRFNFQYLIWIQSQLLLKHFSEKHARKKSYFPNMNF
jgi:hypothetical protein